MPANIDTATDGRAAFMSVREDAWHRLGTVVPANVTAEEGLKLAHLDYEVTKVPLTATINGVSLAVPGKFATVRPNPWYDETFPGEPSHQVLGVVGAGYRVVQNRENCAFLDALVGESGATYETMGALAGGRRTFVSMKAPKGLLIGGRDAVDLYLVAYNSHDASSPFGVIATPVRVVCQNTLDAALRNNAGRWTTRHTVNAMNRVEEAQAALNLMWTFAEEFQAVADAMIAAPIYNDTTVDKVLDRLFPLEDNPTERVKNIRWAKITEVKELYRGETNAEITGTAWGLYNALTEWADWKLPVKGDDDARAERVAAGGWVREFKQEALRHTGYLAGIRL